MEKKLFKEIDGILVLIQLFSVCNLWGEIPNDFLKDRLKKDLNHFIRWLLIIRVNKNGSAKKRQLKIVNKLIK